MEIEVDDAQTMYNKLQTMETKSLLKQTLTQKEVDQLKDLKTKFGGTLARGIRSGVIEADSKVGCHATDEEYWTLFAPFMDQIIRKYHMIPDNLPIQHPPTDFGDLDNLGIGNLDPSGKYVMSTRVRVGRSVKGFAFAPVLTKADRKKIEEQLIAAYNSLDDDDDYKGEYLPLTGMSKEKETQLIKDHYLFKCDDKFHDAVLANRDWPDARGIFINFKKEKRFLSWCNEADHLRLISMQDGGDLEEVYVRLVKGIEKVGLKVDFARSDTLGNLTYCPSNLGTTLRASVLAKVPRLSKNMDSFKAFCAGLKIQARGVFGEHTKSEDGVFDLSNKRRLGLTEIEAIREMKDGVLKILAAEKELETCAKRGAKK